MLTSSLDYYKPNMSQLAWLKEPDVEATLTYHNRGGERLLDYVDPARLQEHFDAIGAIGWQAVELAGLAKHTDSTGQPRYQPEYLEYLAENPLPTVEVTISPSTDDIAIKSTGPWPLVTFWETTIMPAVGQAYSEGFVREHGLDMDDIYAEGDRRIDDKIAIMKANPEMKVVEFGTRRRFSLRWQEHVLERMLEECPGNIIGTSNIALAEKFGIPPVGTYAHEMPMVYAALADARGEDIRGSQRIFRNDWHDLYGYDLSIELPDTFGTKAFFEDQTEEEARTRKGLRHDSGPASQFGNTVLQKYQSFDIDPIDKTLLFSDGLMYASAASLHHEFHTQAIDAYGIGTETTCDVPVPHPNSVAKITDVYDRKSGNTAGTVKLSENPEKHIGSPGNIARYQRIFA